MSLYRLWRGGHLRWHHVENRILMSLPLVFLAAVFAGVLLAGCGCTHDLRVPGEAAGPAEVVVVWCGECQEGVEVE